ncbi:Ypt/Rab-GAP domain of gyp1p superfamily protein isoform 2 [Hibiscus syriacus]|uniref:Ypt/Rab-GAP domain of gyp1p superfamily protein isoform 2 n=1 Tax=Hibiscus syriacus TaxID=106335 RepID=A0A6A3C061_HIBSY|nr:Ypt/Rab-GAP domain of gyp1p superfamily protein isoform 2 [Hibiscus syriacus]
MIRDLKKKKENQQEKRRYSILDLSRLGVTVVSPYIAFFMLFLSSDDSIASFKKWTLFAEASTSGGGGGGGFWSYYSVVSPSGIAIAFTAMAGIALAATIVYSRRSSLKSPWSIRKRKHALQPKEWKSLFTEDGKLSDGGVKFMKKVRSGGVDPSIRAEFAPVHQLTVMSACLTDMASTVRKKKENPLEDGKGKGMKACGNGAVKFLNASSLEDVVSGRRSHSTEGGSPEVDDSDILPCDQSHQPLLSSDSVLEGDTDKSAITCEDGSTGESESSDSDSSEELENPPLFASEITEENGIGGDENANSVASGIKGRSKYNADEDFAMWQRIIRVDAVRTNDEWIAYASAQASVSEIKARELAESVCLKEYDHLEPCRIHHAARLVVILEAYTLYDPEIGYCQGMSDLLSPLISVIEDDFLAFWCFAGFMKKARHNFRLDEAGIRRQLNIVSKIIKCKDIHLYKHLEELQAEDCFFVYRMVVVLFRRELNFEQTLCLWEVVWADQAAIRASITKSGWGKMRLKPPPTDDLLLYAIAACVLQRRKQIIEMYGSMDEIMRECHSMAGQLDVWKLLDDAHHLVVNLREKI